MAPIELASTTCKALGPDLVSLVARFVYPKAGRDLFLDLGRDGLNLFAVQLPAVRHTTATQHLSRLVGQLQSAGPTAAAGAAGSVAKPRIQELPQATRRPQLQLNAMPCVGGPTTGGKRQRYELLESLGALILAAAAGLHIPKPATSPREARSELVVPALTASKGTHSLGSTMPAASMFWQSAMRDSGCKSREARQRSNCCKYPSSFETLL